jgi:hypothetical protein
MKRLVWIALLVGTMVMTGCAAKTDSPAVAGDTASSSLIVVDDALGTKNGMLIGIYNLQDTDFALSAEQSAGLATLWQAYKTVTTSSTSATAETEALITQMQSTLTSDQIAAINAMALDAEDLQTFYARVGIEMPTPAPGETPNVSGGGGAGQDLTDEEKAARRAASANTEEGGSSRATIVMDKVIEYLQEGS